MAGSKQATVVREKSIGARPNLFKSGLNAAATISFAPGRVMAELFGLCWSYNAVPTGGRMTIMGGGFNFDIDITADGPGFIPFPAPMHATDNTAVVVTLYAGGANVTGKLNVLGIGSEDAG